MKPSILYEDKRILVVVKPQGVLSTNEPGGMPDLLRDYLGDAQACVRTVHRLDQTVGGVMVYARSREAARLLSLQIASHQFTKEYLAVVHGKMEKSQDQMHDLLFRDKRTRSTCVVDQTGKNVKEAVLDYRVLAEDRELSLLQIHLHTGRTHQIRVQLSSHQHPIAGDRHYGISDQFERIALWSYRLSFMHPETGQSLVFSSRPPDISPWSGFLGAEVPC